MIIPETTRWFGTAEAVHSLDGAMRQVLRNPVDPAVLKMYDDDEEDERNPITIDLVGGLAILNISGDMMNRANWLTRYLGIATYQDIRSQVTKLAQDERVKGMMLNLDSSGGMAEGCFALCRFIRAVNDNIKPVVSFTDSKAHSAAYALMVSGSKKLMSEDASVGSVGVIAVHAEMTKMYEEIGIKHTVFRSAPYKALGQSVEKLSEEAKAEFEKEIKQLHDSFVGHIAGMTGLDKAFVSESIATGKTFTAKESKKLQMVDNVMTLEEAAGKISAALEKSRPTKAIPQR